MAGWLAGSRGLGPQRGLAYGRDAVPTTSWLPEQGLCRSGDEYFLGAAGQGDIGELSLPSSLSLQQSPGPQVSLGRGTIGWVMGLQGWEATPVGTGGLEGGVMEESQPGDGRRKAALCFHLAAALQRSNLGGGAGGAQPHSKGASSLLVASFVFPNSCVGLSAEDLGIPVNSVSDPKYAPQPFAPSSTPRAQEGHSLALLTPPPSSV